MSDRISQEQYRNLFSDKRKQKLALQHALDIRKFEIELYWKRATYFWTFIAATFAGYGAVQAASNIKPDVQAELSVALCCLGVVFSVGWFCVNKGSKQWQENWENHVDMLEDEVVGPLYKTVMKRPPVSERPNRTRTEAFSEFLTGPAPYSVSKVNQIISIFVGVLWVILLLKTLPPFSFKADVNWFYVIVISVAALACMGIGWCAQTDEDDYVHTAYKRATAISPSSSTETTSACEAESQSAVNQEVL